MSDQPEPTPTQLSGQNCARCGHWSAHGRSACPSCLAPLNATGVFQGVQRPPSLARSIGLGALAGLFALIVTVAAVPDLRRRVWPGPGSTADPMTASSASRPDSYGPVSSQGESGTGKTARRKRRHVLAQAESDPDAAPGEAPRPAKYEPEEGCLIGAYVLQDENINGSMNRWEEETGKGHASYLRYVGYGRPFPEEWVTEVRSVGAVPNIAFEPNAGLGEVRDDDYLRRWAQTASRSGGPVFLRFASEMNGEWTAYHGDPARYRSKFRMVASVMRKYAPNVAMVWTPYCMPSWEIPPYYPGDEAVDWVGINIYSVHHHNGRADRPAHWEDPTLLLRTVYDRYSGRKPIQISEFASTRFCKACGEETRDFAITKMKRMYSSLPRRFPRVKMIYWFSYDTISTNAAENDYAVTGEPTVLKTYRRLISSDYFIPRLAPTELGLAEVGRGGPS